MKTSRLLFLLVAWAFDSLAVGQTGPTTIAEGLTKPSFVVVGEAGKIFVACQDGDNSAAAIMQVKSGKPVPFASGLNEPRGIASFRQWLYVAVPQSIKRIGRNGKVEDYVDAQAFPSTPHSLTAPIVDGQSGVLYVCDAGNANGEGSAIYSVSPKKQVTALLTAKQLASLRSPSGLVLDGASQLILLDGGSGELHRVNIATDETERLAGNLVGCEGLTWDPFGRLIISDPKRDRLLVIPRPGGEPVPMTTGLSTADFCLAPAGNQLLASDRKTGSLLAVPITVPGAEVDERPLALETEPAFPDLHWAGWTGDINGKPDPLRPILLTHAGDGSNRVFVATQQGVVHVFPNEQHAKQTEVILDLHDRVAYNDKTNEEGFLGLAFHPRFKDNGELFVFYTLKTGNHTNVLSRFKLPKGESSRVDPNSGEELFRVSKPSWNHDGGTLSFGPDGYLYVALGDGGLQMDPYENGQNLQVLFGKILRIDVDHQADGRPYAIPPDNPFVGRSDARPEIWAYGLRNVWRMAFDRATGTLWAGDVGESLYEEIDLIQRGGNYGWNRREGLHPFGAKGRGTGKEFIDPIWEYRHDVGACIIGGSVYRGRRLPELQGYYVYADYTNGKLRALRYDPQQRRVVENRPIRDNHRAVLSFGEDEQGEVYLLSAANDGHGIFRYARRREP
jgi:glucose/arabinose dehydrogenase